MRRRMSLDFLTDKFIINKHDFQTPIIVTGAGGCIAVSYTHLRAHET